MGPLLTKLEENEKALFEEVSSLATQDKDWSEIKKTNSIYRNREKILIKEEAQINPLLGNILSYNTTAKEKFADIFLRYTNMSSNAAKEEYAEHHFGLIERLIPADYSIFGNQKPYFVQLSQQEFELNNLANNLNAISNIIGLGGGAILTVGGATYLAMKGELNLALPAGLALTGIGLKVNSFFNDQQSQITLLNDHLELANQLDSYLQKPEEN